MVERSKVTGPNMTFVVQYSNGPKWTRKSTSGIKKLAKHQFGPWSAGFGPCFLSRMYV
jgi:hypothetical protein